MRLRSRASILESMLAEFVLMSRSPGPPRIFCTEVRRSQSLRDGRTTACLSGAGFSLRHSKSNRASINLFAQVGEKFREWPRAEIAFALLAHGNGARFGFFAPDDQHVGNFQELRIANFRLQLFVAVVEMRAESGVLQSGGTFFPALRAFFAARPTLLLRGRRLP